jgi:uncharacterized membrane protein
VKRRNILEGIIFLIIVAAILFFLCGPIALIIAIYAHKKIGDLNLKLQFGRPPAKPEPPPEEKKPEEVKEPETIPEPPHKPPITYETVEPIPIAPQPQEKIPEPEKTALPTEFTDSIKSKISEVTAFTKPGSLEQRIGTRWVLVAGIITVIVGVALFLKYVYDNNLIGPTGIVLIVGASGLAALVLGEITRRRGYGIVAKGVTALGFAILYADIFTAQQYYGLILSTTSFILASSVTAAALIYAVTLDETLIAFLSLLGGYLTPVIVSTGQNLPIPLFTYTLILSLGAISAAIFRKWRAVDWVAFIGTYLLYTGWFEKFYRPDIMLSPAEPQHLSIAVGWLTVFFAVYLVLPVLYELIKKVNAKKESILILLANATHPLLSLGYSPR